MIMPCKKSSNFVLETALFPGFITDATLDELAAAKVDRIELCCVPHRFAYHDPLCVEKIADGIKSRGIAVPSVHLPFGPDCDLSSRDRQKRAVALNELEKTTLLAMELGATVMVLHPGVHLEEGENRLERLEIAAVSLRALLERLPESGFCLGVENLLPGYLGESAEELARLIEKLGDDRVGFCLDTGHAHLTGEMAALLRRCGKYLCNIHIHDNSGDADCHLIPGQGTIDWFALMEELDAVDYAGPLTLEIVNEVDSVVRSAIMKQFISGMEAFRPYHGVVTR